MQQVIMPETVEWLQKKVDFYTQKELQQFFEDLKKEKGTYNIALTTFISPYSSYFRYIFNSKNKSL